MLIGIPREIKANENRVSVTPAGVADYVRHGHQVLMEKTAGSGSSISDAEYVQAGAQIAETAREVWSRAEMIVKVKEPIGRNFPSCGRARLFTPSCIWPQTMNSPSV